MDSGLSSEAIIVATKRQVSCELGDEAAILNMKNCVYYGLDPVGARIWRLLQQPRSVGEIRDVIASEYDASPERIERDLQELLEKLLSEGLVEMIRETR